MPGRGGFEEAQVEATVQAGAADTRCDACEMEAGSAGHRGRQGPGRSATVLDAPGRDEESAQGEARAERAALTPMTGTPPQAAGRVPGAWHPPRVGGWSQR